MQRAWWALDQMELRFYKEFPTPTDDAALEDGMHAWPTGYKAVKVGKKLEWQKLHRHDPQYGTFVLRVANSYDDDEAYEEDEKAAWDDYEMWMLQQPPEVVARVAELHRPLDAALMIPRPRPAREIYFACTCGA